MIFKKSADCAIKIKEEIFSHNQEKQWALKKKDEPRVSTSKEDQV